METQQRVLDYIQARQVRGGHVSSVGYLKYHGTRFERLYISSASFPQSVCIDPKTAVDPLGCYCS